MRRLLTLLAPVLASLAATSCTPRSPCDGASSFDVKTGATGNYTLSAKSTWATIRDEGSFEVFVADFDQDPRDLRKFVSGKEGSLVRLSIWNRKPRITAGVEHTFGVEEPGFSADIAHKKPPVSLYGVVFDKATVKGRLTVRAVNEKMVCGDVDLTDGHASLKGRFVAPFAPAK